MAIENKSFYTRPELVAAFDKVKSKSGRLHFLGLVSDGGVHSHITHLEALLKAAKQTGVPNTYVHFFSDGRDTSPVSGGGDVHVEFRILYSWKYLQSLKGLILNGLQYGNAFPCIHTRGRNFCEYNLADITKLPNLVPYFTLVSYPYSSQFFNDVCRKTRELGKIQQVYDVRWNGLGVVHAYTLDFYWERRDGKTDGLSKLESPGAYMLARAKMARNVSILATFHVLDF